MIAIINYETGNIRSVSNALTRIGATFTLTDNHEVIRSADKVILPGVGEASSCMEKLKQKGLDELIRSLAQPVLGICIGMQLMCEYSEENNTQCMGIFPCKVRKLSGEGLKIPHTGWDEVRETENPLFINIPDKTYYYYVHSYAPDLCVDTIAMTCYGKLFSAALNRKNFFGTQFHPEKSGEVGERLLANFLNL